MPPYKTIVLHLLQDHPALHDRLCRSRTLLATVETMGAGLKACHQEWARQLTKSRPNSNPAQIASEAMELAMKDLQDSLPPTSLASDDPETFSLDAAMSFLHRHMPAE